MTPTLKRLGRHDVAGAAQALDLDGAVVLEGLVGATTIAEIDAELAPHVSIRPPGFRPGFDAAFYGKNTTRIQGLAAKSATFVAEYLLHPTMLGICDIMLAGSCGDYWMSQAETIFIGPGEPAQSLHRDDENWTYAQTIGIDLQVSVLLAMETSDAEVGATRVIPGSHRWPLDAPVDLDAVVTVELEPGDALAYLGGVVHGGGANRTESRWRKALYIGFLVGWLTPEEAVALSLPPDVVEALPDRARQLLGWSSMRGNAGMDGTAGALQLWQADADELARHGGLFVNR